MAVPPLERTLPERLYYIVFRSTHNHSENALAFLMHQYKHRMNSPLLLLRQSMSHAFTTYGHRALSPFLTQASFQILLAKKGSLRGMGWR